MTTEATDTASELLKSTGIPYIAHTYCEIGDELTAKPSTLSRIIEGAPTQKYLIFCNAPSDTDLIEIFLRKRGMTCVKLIGNVPDFKKEKAITRVQNNDLTALVVTDVSGQNIDIDNFNVVVNYSVPSDYDTYVQRIEKKGPFTNLSRVVTIVNPVDLTHFHYLRKSVEAEFSIEELPSEEKLLEQKIEKIAQFASTNEGKDKFVSLAEVLLNREDKTQVISFLLYNALELHPITGFKDAESVERFSPAGKRSQNSRSGEDRGGKNQSRSRDGRDGNKEEGSDNRRGRDENRTFLPKLREGRIYIGKGSKDKFTETSLREIFEKEETIKDIVINRVINRPLYTFFDVADEKTETVLSVFAQHEFEGEKLQAQRATTIVSTPEAEKGSSSEIEAQEQRNSDEDGQGQAGAVA